MVCHIRLLEVAGFSVFSRERTGGGDSVVVVGVALVNGSSVSSSLELGRRIRVRPPCSLSSSAALGSLTTSSSACRSTSGSTQKSSVISGQREVRAVEKGKKNSEFKKEQKFR